MGPGAPAKGETCGKSRRSTRSTIRRIGGHHFFRWFAFAVRRVVGAARGPSAGIVRAVMRPPSGGIAKTIAESSLSGARTPRPPATKIFGLATPHAQNLRLPYGAARLSVPGSVDRS